MVLRLCYSGGSGNKSGFNKGKHWPNRSGDCLYHLYFIFSSIQSKQEKFQLFYKT